jgi:Transposase IS116/IS110/IS902 family
LCRPLHSERTSTQNSCPGSGNWSFTPWFARYKRCEEWPWSRRRRLVAEFGDITRFANPRQLMAYLGLVPSDRSSGATRRQRGITKVGKGAARRILIEAAWSYRFPAEHQARGPDQGRLHPGLERASGGRRGQGNHVAHGLTQSNARLSATCSPGRCRPGQPRTQAQGDFGTR